MFFIKEINISMHLCPKDKYEFSDETNVQLFNAQQSIFFRDNTHPTVMARSVL